MRKKATGNISQYIPDDPHRKGDPAWRPVLKDLREDVERTTFTTDPGAAGQKNWPSMYDLARSLTKGKWGNSGS